MLYFDTDVDSLAFGYNGSDLEGLLFISNNNGPEDGDGSELIMVDLATLQHVSVAAGGSRGDMVITTPDGKVLLSQSNQVDVLKPAVAPMVLYTNPPPDSVVALPRGVITVTFDQDMLLGNPDNPGSVLNTSSYRLFGQNMGFVDILSVFYDSSTKTAVLTFDGLMPDQYIIQVLTNIQNNEGVELKEECISHFTAVSDFSSSVEIEFLSVRSERQNLTVSYDILVTNISGYDLVLPVLLVLDPSQFFDGWPLDADYQGEDIIWVIDLTDALPVGGILQPGQSTNGYTVAIQNPTGQTITFEHGIFTLPVANLAPVFDSLPLTIAMAGQTYQYQVLACDPDGLLLTYLLYDAPDGMTVETDTGLVSWEPTSESPSEVRVVLRVYDMRGGYATQEFSISVNGGNRPPVLNPIAVEFHGYEGQPLQVVVSAVDPDGDSLIFWADNLPPGAVFDANAHALQWVPESGDAGTYEDVTFFVSDGVNRLAQATTILIAPTNQAPVLIVSSDRTAIEGQTVRLQLSGYDPEGHEIAFSSNAVPAGAVLDPNMGLFRWAIGYSAAGEYEIPFAVSDGELSSTGSVKITVTNENATPEFFDVTGWQVYEGQTIRQRIFCSDPDNPGYIPPDRLGDGSLTPLEGSQPSVTYSLSALPAGAAFDYETWMFEWTPTFDQAGDYIVTFTATDDGDGTGVNLFTSIDVPITILNFNRTPEIADIFNQQVNRGEVLEITINAADPDGDVLVLTAENAIAGYALPDFAAFTDNGDGTASLRFEPDFDHCGDYVIRITATDDGNGQPSAALSDDYTFVVSVLSPNETPRMSYIGDKVAVIGQTLEFTIYVSDLDQDSLTFNADGLVAGASLVPGVVYGTAVFSWSPGIIDVGAHVITFRVTDSGNGNPAEVLSDEETINIVVRGTNAAPVLNPVGNQIASEAQELSVILSADDPDGDALTYYASNLPAGAEFDSAAGILTWSPGLFQAGTYQNIVLGVTDGNKSDSETITITVSNTNQAPVLLSLPEQRGQEGMALQFTLSASDIDNDVLTFSSISALPAGATFDSLTGKFQWTPDYEQSGVYSLQFMMTDAGGLNDMADISINISKVNRLPSIEASNHVVELGQLLSFFVVGGDPDLGTTLAYSAYDLPNGAALDSATGQFDWTPGPGQAGDYVIIFAVSDGESTVTATSLIQAALSPEGPVVTIELTPSFPAVPGQSVLIHPIADSLAEITSLTITVDGVPLALDGQGRAEFIPIQPGRYLVEAVAADADGRNGTANIILKVRDPDDNYAPVVSFGLNYSANYAFTATAWPGELVVMNSQAYDTVAQIPLEDTLLDPSGDAFGVVITPDGSRAYVLLRKSIAVVDTMALQRIDAIWQTSQIDNIMLPEGANTHSFTIDPTGDYIYVSDVVQSVIYQISVNPADKGFYNTCVALFNLSLPVAGLRGLDVTSDGKRLYVASPYSYVGWNGSSFDGKIVVVDVDQDADPNGFNIGLELGEINLGYHKKPTGINADSGNPYLITYTDMEGGFGLIIASENDIGKVEREILIDNEGMEIAILPGNTLGGKFAGHSTYAFITGFKSELNRPDCPAGGNIVIIKDPFKAGAKVVGFTRPIPYGLPAGLAVSPDGQNLYVTYQRPDSIFVFSIPAILEQIKASEGKTIDNIGTPRLSYYPVNNWTQDEWLANAAIDIKADYRMDVPFLEDAGHDNTFQVHNENRAPISLAGSPWGIAVLQDIDTELKPVVDGVGDHLFFKNGDSFTFNLENDTAEGVGSNGNIVFVIDIEGPYKQFISFSVGTNEVAIEPSDEIVFAPQEQLKLTVTMKNIIAKNYNYDQLFGVVITIKAFAQRGAQDVLLEKSMCIIRFVSVTDPSGYTRYARFMKSLNDGPDKFVREKTIEYHLPQNMETTSQKGTTQWDSTDMFILPDGPFVGEGSMAWKFDPTENGSRAMELRLLIDGTLRNTGPIVLHGTAIDRSIVSVDVDGFMNELAAFLLNRDYFDSDTTNGEASNQFKSYFAGILPTDWLVSEAEVMERVATEATLLLQKVQNDFYRFENRAGVYSPSSPDGMAIQIVANNNDIPVEAQEVTSVWGLFTPPDPGKPAYTPANSGPFGLASKLDQHASSLETYLQNVNLSPAAVAYAFTEFHNFWTTVGTAGPEKLNVWFSIFVHAWKYENPAISFATYCANTVSHELAHTFGVDEAYYAPTQGPDVGKVQDVPPKDIMRSGSKLDPDLGFAWMHFQTMMAAVGVAPNEVDAVFLDTIRKAAKNFMLPEDKNGIPIHIRILETAEEPYASLVAGETLLFPEGHLDFGTVVADGIGGDSLSMEITLFNDGRAPLTVSGIELAAGSNGFSLVDIPIDEVVLDIGQTIIFTLVFDPGQTGSLSDSLIVYSDAVDSPQLTIQLEGVGLTEFGRVNVSVATEYASGQPNSNVGGLSLFALPGQDVTLPGVINSGDILPSTGPFVVTVDFQNITEDTIVTLYFDLIGFAPFSGVVSIDDVVLITEGMESPTADAAGPYQGWVDVPLSFDAGGSSDTDGEIVLYEWDWDSNGIYETSGMVPTAEHTWSLEYSGTVTLRVTDSDGLIDIDTALVGIEQMTNVLPVVDAGDDQSINEGSTFSRSGSFSDGNAEDAWTATVDYEDGSGVQALILIGTTFDLNHTYLDNGIYDITVAVTDSSDETGTDTFTLTVVNVAPTVDAGPDQMASEGDTVNFSGSFTDPGVLDTHTYLWDFGDGSTSAELDTSHVYADNGVYTVTLTVTDNDGASGSYTLTVTVDNVAPTVEAGPDQNANEGDTVNFSGSFTDPGVLDTHTYLWDFGDGANSADLDTSHAYSDNGVYTITLTVIDNDGASGSDTLTVTVSNVALIVEAGTDQDANEGDTVNFSGSCSEPCDTYLWDFGDGTNSNELDTSHIYTDNGVYAVTLTATLSGVGSSSDTLTVTVTNVAPVVGAGPDQTAREGDTVNFSGSFTDPGILDTHICLWDFGDGTTSTDLDTSHIYTDNGVYTVTLTVTDNDGGVGIDSLTVTVGSTGGQAPEITEIVITENINENDIAILAGQFIDPDMLDTHIVVIDWVDDSGEMLVLPVGDRSFSTEHQYLDDEPSGTEKDDYTIGILLTDLEDGSDTASSSVTVNNLAPEIITFSTDSGGCCKSVCQREVFIFAEFTDIGTLDSHSANIEWGDGTITTGQIDEAGGAGSVSASHIYTDGGIYEIKLTITDDDTGSDTKDISQAFTGVRVIDGVLQIVGTCADDHVTINMTSSCKSSRLKVHANFLPHKVNGNNRGRGFEVFDASQINKIVVLVCDGNDKVTVAGNIDITVIIDGGSGSDKIKGGDGADVILGAEDNDTIRGGGGRDVLIGGDDRDRIISNSGDDILIGGTTIFDIDDADFGIAKVALGQSFDEPLMAILAEWDSPRDYSTRMNNLIDGSGSSERLNGSFFLQKGLTVFDDEKQDCLTGSSGIDWLLLFDLDRKYCFGACNMHAQYNDDIVFLCEYTNSLNCYSWNTHNSKDSEKDNHRLVFLRIIKKTSGT